MSFESFKFKKVEKEKEHKKQETIEVVNQELSQELKNDSILSKFRNSNWLKRIVFLGAFLSAVEVFGQDKQTIENSVDLARKAVLELDAFVKNNPDKKGEIDISGFGKSKFFEKNLGNKKIHSNDFYLYIKDEKIEKDGVLRTEYGVDVGKDGLVDEVVIIPGKVDKMEEVFIISSFGKSNIKSLSTEASMASMEREIKDKPSLHRIVYFLEKNDHQKWYMVNFEEGTFEQLENPTKIQYYWEAKTTLTILETK